MRTLTRVLALSCLLGTSSLGQAQHTGQLSQNGWHSDDTRADGTGTQPAGTNLVSPVLTDTPEGLSGNPAHDADIRRQIRFGPAPGVVPAGTHSGAVQLRIGAAAAGKSSISHRKDDPTGHCSGAAAFGPGMSLQYHWMGTGTPSVTAGLKIGVKTSEFGLAGVSPRTGENTWDKLLIYEPGNLNGGVSNGSWFTENVDHVTGRWWFFDRVAGAGTIGTPLTLADMSTSGIVFSGGKTIQDVYDLVTAPGAVVTSIQLGIGSANANGNVYVNQLETSFYRPGSVTTFGSSHLACDQDVTSNVIFGSGNVNGSFTVARSQGVELGLRAKLRFDSSNQPQNVFNSNGDGTYTFQAGAPSGPGLPGWASSTTPRWNIEWSVNTDFDGTSGLKLEDLTYELRMDFEAGVGANSLVFDPIGPNSALPYDTPFTQVFWDHATGTNATGPGGGTTAGSLVAYQALLGANNLAQNSWSPEFFNESPFDGFDPSVQGRYEFSLAAFDGPLEVARTAITVFAVAVEEFDQNVTNAVIFGSGNVNGSFTTVRGSGVELGMRAKLRFDSSNQPQNVFHSNGDGTYTYEAGFPSGPGLPGWASSTTARWNIEWSINTDHDGASGLKLDDLTYELGMDFDAGAGSQTLAFDPIALNSTLPFTAPLVMPFWDHAIGDNSTGSGGGSTAGSSGAYASLLAANNLAQNSWNPEFFNEAPFDGFDPTLPGRYDFYLAAYDGLVEIARTEIAVLVRDGTSLSLEAPACQQDALCNLPGVQIAVELWMRNLATDVTGYQAFLAFDPTRLTYEGSASGYSAAPFPLHIQSVSGAEVAPGQLRVDGSVMIGSPDTHDEDALLATLIFTVAAECDPTSVIFDLTQSFDSELSFQGSAVATNLVDAASIQADATPPILAPMADLIVPADAGVGGGCASAVVNFTPPFAFDTCGDVTVQCFPPPGTAFPAGQTTTVTCIATDECGNEAVETFDITVTSTNLVYVELQLVGVNTAVERCIRFVPNSCGSGVDVELPFDASGFFSGLIELPCGNWSSLCVKDEQHTLWASTTLSLDMSGTMYVGDSVVQLHGGDTDNDGDVDINDVTWFLFQFGQLAADGDCAWDGTRDADFDNNGAVGSSDYAFLTANWLSTSACGCLGPLPEIGPTDASDRVRRRVTTSMQASVDFNGDGWIDREDVRIFERRWGLPNALSERMRR